jgi:hypothetical protein
VRPDPDPRSGNAEDAIWPKPKDMKRGASLHAMCERAGQRENSGMMKDTPPTPYQHQQQPNNPTTTTHLFLCKENKKTYYAIPV